MTYKRRGLQEWLDIRTYVKNIWRTLHSWGHKSKQFHVEEASLHPPHIIQPRYLLSTSVISAHVAKHRNNEQLWDCVINFVADTCLDF